MTGPKIKTNYYLLAECYATPRSAFSWKKLVKIPPKKILRKKKSEIFREIVFQFFFA
jgi:hypothetical protein